MLFDEFGFHIITFVLGVSHREGLTRQYSSARHVAEQTLLGYGRHKNRYGVVFASDVQSISLPVHVIDVRLVVPS